MSISIVGYLNSGRPVYAIAGAAEDDPPSDPATGNDDPPADPDPDNVPDPAAEAEKWKGLARKHESQAKKNADAAKRLQEIEDAEKTEQDRLQEQLDAAKAEGTAASARLRRLDVALDKAPEGMPVAKVRKLAARLSGDTLEDLEADAEELFADFAVQPDTGNSRPKEKLKPGASNSDDDPEQSPAELADAVRKRQRGY